MTPLPTARPATDLTISENAWNYWKHAEGFRLRAYEDQGGVWTIGFGHTQGVKPGDVCTPAEAAEWLHQDAHRAITTVQGAVKVLLTQQQFDALVLLCENIGSGAFIHSTLLKKLNRGDYVGAAREFPRWCHVHGQVSDGLYDRRLEEQDIFEMKKAPDAYATGAF